MELIQMQAFVSLAQTQYMPRTAQEMNTSQSNEHGRIFYEYASNALQMVRNGETALKSLRGSVIGTVRIGSYAFFCCFMPSNVGKQSFAPCIHSLYIYKNFGCDFYGLLVPLICA